MFNLNQLYSFAQHTNRKQIKNLIAFTFHHKFSACIKCGKQNNVFLRQFVCTLSSQVKRKEAKRERECKTGLQSDELQITYLQQQLIYFECTRHSDSSFAITFLSLSICLSMCQPKSFQMVFHYFWRDADYISVSGSSSNLLGALHISNAIQISQMPFHDSDIVLCSTKN